MVPAGLPVCSAISCSFMPRAFIRYSSRSSRLSRATSCRRNSTHSSSEISVEKSRGAVLAAVGAMPLLPVLTLHEVNGWIPDDRLQEGDELGSRAATKLRKASGVKGGQRIGENVFRVGCGQPERSERPAANLLERREKGPPSIRIPALTSSHQVE